ncbi:MAG TPA: hypothetical protein QF695_04285, partial [Arenicellales bacterium]|nr:hypothetical protein [Arenicellales bacterium]
PYGNYIPRASSRICELIVDGNIDAAKKIQHLIDEMQEVIEEGHPTYGHQCYSKALAALAGYPVGDVRPPLTTFKELGVEGQQRLEKLGLIMSKLNDLVDKIDGKLAA